MVSAYLSKLGWTNICLSFLSLYYIKIPEHIVGSHVQLISLMFDNSWFKVCGLLHFSRPIYFLSSAEPVKTIDRDISVHIDGLLFEH